MHEIKLPQLGQSVEEASIVRWLKAEGDAVKTGDALVSIQTDKAEIEWESPVAGTLRKILLEPDVTAPVMTVIALIGDANEALPDLAQYKSGAAPAATASAPGEATSSPAVTSTPTQAAQASGSASAPVSPRAKRKAESLKVSPRAAQGTGVGGRVMESDVLAYAERIKDIKISPTAQRIALDAGLDITQLTGTGPGGKITKEDVERAAATQPAARAGRLVPLTPMRKIIARRMCDSFFTAPHYYVTVEVDMSALVAYRKALVFKASYNDLVILATVRALQQFSQVNARWREDTIEEVAEVNLGFAVALPTGLVVPVIRNAQSKSLEQITNESRSLGEKARAGKLAPDDYSGNTFTISNLGVLGVDNFTAIINQPDSAILAVGQMKDRVVAIDGGIHIRPIMKLTLSSDHRVIDGAVAAQFMGALKTILEQAGL